MSGLKEVIDRIESRIQDIKGLDLDEAEQNLSSEDLEVIEDSLDEADNALDNAFSDLCSV